MTQELLRAALDAARAGAAVVREADLRRDFAVSTKSRADYVTEVDVASERAITALLRERFPDHAILAEEGGLSGAPGEWRWVIDPLDGTTNFIRGIPFFATCVGLEHHGVPVAGAVVEPQRGTEWWGMRGRGAFKDGEPIRVSPQPDLSLALALTGIPFRSLGELPVYLPGMARVARATSGIRRMGSAALDLCSIADGRAEAFWEYGLSRWDLVAGVAIIEEAGGRVTDLSGGATHMDTGHVLATNGLVHAGMLACVDPNSIT